MAVVWPLPKSAFSSEYQELSPKKKKPADLSVSFFREFGQPLNCDLT